MSYFFRTLMKSRGSMLLFLPMLFLYASSYFQRTAVPGTIFNQLQTDLNLNAFQIAAMGASFIYIYALSQTIVGMLADTLHQVEKGIDAPGRVGSSGVVARCLSRRAREASVPRLNARGVDDAASHPGLEEHRVEVGFLQPVQDAAQFVFLRPDSLFRSGLGLGPVQTGVCGEPHGPRFPFGRFLQEKRLGGKCGRRAEYTYI